MAPRSDNPDLVATGYTRGEDGTEEVRQSSYPYNRMYVPCGCIASNVVEMTRFATASLHRGVLDGVRILGKQSYSDMWQVQVPRDVEGPHLETALGWWVRRPSQELIVEHEGADDGFRTHFCLWVDRGLSIVVLCNADWPDPDVDVTPAVFDIVASAS